MTLFKLKLWVCKSKCTITLSKFLSGPGDLIKTVVECVYNKYLLLDIHVFTKHFGKMSSLIYVTLWPSNLRLSDFLFDSCRT